MMQIQRSMLAKQSIKRIKTYVFKTVGQLNSADPLTLTP